MSAKRLFGFGSDPGPDGSLPSMPSPVTKYNTPESPLPPILNLPVAPAQSLDQKHPPPMLAIDLAPCHASAMPEQHELDTLNDAERGESAYASATALAELPFADDLNSFEHPAEPPAEASASPEDGVDDPGAWKMKPGLPNGISLDVCVCV